VINELQISVVKLDSEVKRTLCIFSSAKGRSLMRTKINVH